MSSATTVIAFVHTSRSVVLPRFNHPSYHESLHCSAPLQCRWRSHGFSSERKTSFSFQGTSSRKHLRENLAAAELALSTNTVDTLDSVESS